MDIFSAKNLIHKLYDKKAISGEEFDILNDFLSAQNNTIESLKSENNKKEREILSLKGV